MPGVVKVERGAMIYEPEALMPEEQVGVASRAVHVGDVGIEPNDGGGEVGVERRGGGGRIGEGAGQVVEGEVEAGAGLDEIADLVVRLGAAKDGVKLHQDDIG